MEARSRSGTPGLVCKLNIEKAYDHVNSNLLMYLLRRMGFGVRWCRWIRRCVSTAKFFVLINRVPQGYFASSRGLRQGDPLSPLLFILVMEAFNHMMGRVVESGWIRGFSFGTAGPNTVSISNLLSADDAIVFCDAELWQVRALKFLLICFEAVSGLRINAGKCELIPIRGEGIGEELVGIMGCRIGSFPNTYLGLPLGAKYKSRSIWDPVLERMRRRLAGWKNRFLSKGGKLTLIKSTLSSLPTYFISILPLPIGVHLKMEKLMRDFLWRGTEDSFKHSLVRWEEVCKPIQEGGRA